MTYHIGITLHLRYRERGGTRHDEHRQSSTVSRLPGLQSVARVGSLSLRLGGWSNCVPGRPMSDRGGTEGDRPSECQARADQKNARAATAAEATEKRGADNGQLSACSSRRLHAARLWRVSTPAAAVGTTSSRPVPVSACAVRRCRCRPTSTRFSSSRRTGIAAVPPPEFPLEFSS